MKTIRLLAPLLLLFAACTDAPHTAPSAPLQQPVQAAGLAGGDAPAADPFGDYWYQGEAELTSYTLQQARYGEVHDGHAVLIFVTEDVSARKQVKLDDPQRAGDDAVKVLKLNLTKQFNTGIYPYSMMTSVFTPVYRDRHPRTLKVTTSSQEWCGHTFSQLNLTDDGYRVQQLSYFEREGDLTRTLPAALPEDAVWNLIRLDPDALPTGTVRMIPGTLFQRLRHKDWAVQEATATRAATGDGLMTYTLTYPEDDRTLSIHYRAAFPHEIEGWEETYHSGWGDAAGPLTTRATRNRQLMLAYWNHNSLADEALRQELGLD